MKNMQLDFANFGQKESLTSLIEKVSKLDNQASDLS